VTVVAAMEEAPKDATASFCAQMPHKNVDFLPGAKYFTGTLSKISEFRILREF